MLEPQVLKFSKFLEEPFPSTRKILELHPDQDMNEEARDAVGTE